MSTAQSHEKAWPQAMHAAQHRRIHHRTTEGEFFVELLRAYDAFVSEARLESTVEALSKLSQGHHAAALWQAGRWRFAICVVATAAAALRLRETPNKSKSLSSRRRPGPIVHANSWRPQGIDPALRRRGKCFNAFLGLGHPQLPRLFFEHRVLNFAHDFDQIDRCG